MTSQYMGVGYACQFVKNSAKVGDVRLEYLTGGKGSPLLYLHGLAAWTGWDTDHISLGLTNTVYAVVLPGWKAGQFPEPIHRIRDFTPVLKDFIATIGAERIDLIGHCVGGWLALYLASEYPERIGKLILVDSMGLELPEAPVADLKAMDEDAIANATFASKSGNVVVAGDFGGVPLNLRRGALFRQHLRGCQSLLALTSGRLSDPDLAGRLPAISAPTLIIWGDQDGIVPKRHGEVLAASIPGATLAVMEGAGNIPQKEKPQTYLRIVRNFLLDQREELPGVRFVSTEHQAKELSA